MHTPFSALKLLPSHFIWWPDFLPYEKQRITVPCSPLPCLLLVYRPSTTLLSVICFPGQTIWAFLLLPHTEMRNKNNSCTLSSYLIAPRSMYAWGRDGSRAQPELYTVFKKRVHHRIYKTCHNEVLFCSQMLSQQLLTIHLLFHYYH